MEEDELYIERLRCIVEQKKINDDGSSDEVLQRQVELNKRRHEYNIVDSEEIVYVDEEGRSFVQ